MSGKKCQLEIWILELSRKRNTVGPLYPWVPHLQIQPTGDQKYWGKNPESYKKQSLNLLRAGKYLH